VPVRIVLEGTNAVEVGPDPIKLVLGVDVVDDYVGVIARHRPTQRAQKEACRVF